MSGDRINSSAPSEAKLHLSVNANDNDPVSFRLQSFGLLLGCRLLPNDPSFLVLSVAPQVSRPDSQRGVVSLPGRFHASHSASLEVDTPPVENPVSGRQLSPASAYLLGAGDSFSQDFLGERGNALPDVRSITAFHESDHGVVQCAKLSQNGTFPTEKTSETFSAPTERIAK